ncbi:hypothetical protein NQ315_014378 [Exocentrus adspersus]|uniref:Retrotransposon gag domain-containing protein n=1 Tax=Exocentrus adspersus TaxID=1586481 RepID=A0AAV8V6S4_9CUCU|nr:hypothetical protein NQ315_014378 [Exocentrus adspersus]
MSAHDEVMDLELGNEHLLEGAETSVGGSGGSRSPPRRFSRQVASTGAGAATTSVDDLLKALLEGGLTSSIQRIAKQQAALVVGDLSEGMATTSRGSGESGREASASERRSLNLCHDVVDCFDPEDPDSHIVRWLHQIDQLGIIYGWTSYEWASIAQAKLVGAARRWFHQLDDFDLSWEQWKEKLRAAFPRRRDFADMLQEMMYRRKLPTESMTTYYHTKLALCSRVDISGIEAVSCIISGFPANLKANVQAARCQTPEVVYDSFLAGLETYRGEGAHRRLRSRIEVVPKRETAISQRSFSQTREPRRCYNCQKKAYHLQGYWRD